MKSGQWRRQAGVSLIEFLVALLVTAIGVLGAAALQMNAVKFNQMAGVRSQATVLSYDIVDRLRANREAALDGQYDLNIDDDAPTGGAVHESDLREWREQLADRLPGGRGSIARDDREFTITVRWHEGRLEATREPGADDWESFVVTTEL